MMADDVIGARADIEAMRARIEQQEAELERLRAERSPSGPTRRDMLKGAGLVAGSLAALTAGVGANRANQAAAVEGHNVRLRGGDSIFLTLTGSRQGQIRGDVTQKGREHTIEVEYLQLKVKSPTDPATGQSTGRRQYEPLIIRKRVEKSTPLLLNAIIQNENLTAGSFKFYRVDARTGAEAHFYTIELKSARIVSHNEYAPQGNDSGGGTPVPTMEEVGFAFQSITWTIVDGGITAQDDWNSTA